MQGIGRERGGIVLVELDQSADEVAGIGVQGGGLAIMGVPDPVAAGAGAALVSLAAFAGCAVPGL